jgi:hypothetical protein
MAPTLGSDSENLEGPENDNEDDNERADLERQEELRREADDDVNNTIHLRRTRRQTGNVAEGRRLRQRLIDTDEEAYTHEDATQRASNRGRQEIRTPPPHEDDPNDPDTPNEIGIVAALKRKFPHGFPPEMVAEELNAQAQIKGDGARMAVFRVETLQHQELTAFGFLQQNDMTIHLLHSAASYHARGATGPLKGKDIAFVGDRTTYSSPAPIILQPEKPWKWVMNKFVTDEVAIELFYANPNNRHKFFTAQTGTPTENIKLPRLLLLPSNLVLFCAKEPRTPLTLLRHVERLKAVMIPTSDNPESFTHHDYDLIANWCCAALHGDKDGSLLRYDIQAAVGNGPFFRWMNIRLDNTLGPRTQQPLPQFPSELGQDRLEQLSWPNPFTTPLHQIPPNIPTGHPNVMWDAAPTQPTPHPPRHAPPPTPNQQGAPPQPTIPPHASAPAELSGMALLAAEFGKGIMAALQPGQAGISALGATTVKEYDVFQLAILQGFAHTPSPAGLPRIWSLFCQTKATDTHRIHLREAMSLWARNTGVTINRGMYLTKLAIDDIVNLRFNPGGSAAYYATAEKGISILLCRSRPGEDRESARQQELAEELSSTNRTLSEAITLHKSAPRAPPDSYSDLKAGVATFCALVWALFGEGCEYYRKLYEIYLCLDSDRASEDWANFTPLLCRQITWAILDDGREYFAQVMLPDKFAVPPGTLIRYPQSSLEELIRPIRTQAPILRANFPSQWLPRSDAAGTNTVARQLGPVVYASAAPVPLVTVGGGGSTRGGGASAGRSTTSSITNPTVKDRPKHIRADNIHPLIKRHLEPHFQRFGQLQLVRLMKLGGVTWKQMPKLDKYMDGTTNKLCYNYVLGRCTTRYCSHKQGHAPADDITTVFANELVNLLNPGIVHMTEALMEAPWPEFQAIAAERVRQQQAEHNA